MRRRFGVENRAGERVSAVAAAQPPHHHRADDKPGDARGDGELLLVFGNETSPVGQPRYFVTGVFNRGDQRHAVLFDRGADLLWAAFKRQSTHRAFCLRGHDRF